MKHFENSDRLTVSFLLTKDFGLACQVLGDHCKYIVLFLFKLCKYAPFRLIGNFFRPAAVEPRASYHQQGRNYLFSSVLRDKHHIVIFVFPSLVVD